MKSLSLVLIAVTLLASRLSAQIVVAALGDTVGSSPVYGSTYFTGLQLQVGDILVITQANNKNANSGGTISASFTTAGGNTFTALTSTPSGTTSGAWVFYSQITNATTTDVIIDTSSATKTVSQATSYYLLRPSAGYSLVVGATATASATAAASATTGSLSFTLSPGYADAIGFAALAANTGTITQVPAGWARDQNGNNKRQTFFTGAIAGDGTYSGSPVNGSLFTTTWTTDISTDFALAGVVIAANAAPAIPEPASCVLLFCGLALVGRRLRRTRC